ncbi:MAG TPA: sugar ABC transporter ATP-binding protein [Solirubrobacterales bacterium]|jgi:ribose transport system ATP-binding protein
MRTERISKSFGSTQALRDLSFSVTAGEIHGLIGGNGSGKSTLIKILAGVTGADSGEFEIGGKRFSARSFTPSLARQSGMRFVHQRASVFPAMTVAENLALGISFRKGRFGRIQWRAQRRHAQSVLDRFQIDAVPGQELGSARPAIRTMIAIARALQDQEGQGSGVLLLDEPTAALPTAEVDLLVDALKRYARTGQTILLVSHRLDELLSTADTITVLRDGVLHESRAASDYTYDSLTEAIAGRAVSVAGLKSRSTEAADTVLAVSNLKGGAVRGASFELRSGEVLGITGLLGSGKSTLLRLLFGVDQIESGEIKGPGGKPIVLRSPRDAKRFGFAYVPEDRLEDAAFSALSVGENLSIAAVGEYWRSGVLRRSSERKDGDRLVREYQIECAGTTVPLDTLSGGNQQKVLIARWLRGNPRVLKPGKYLLILVETDGEGHESAPEEATLRVVAPKH